MCCSVLQCVALCCSVVECGAVWCSVMQCVTVCYSVLQCVTVCYSVLQGLVFVAVCCHVGSVLEFSVESNIMNLVRLNMVEHTATHCNIQSSKYHQQYDVISIWRLYLPGVEPGISQ